MSMVYEAVIPRLGLHSFQTLLRLSAEVKPVCLTRLREAKPQAADKIEHAIRDMRGGELYDNRFSARMRGQGARWQAVTDLFQLQCKRLGFGPLEGGGDPNASTFERPSAQLKLF